MPFVSFSYVDVEQCVKTEWYMSCIRNFDPWSSFVIFIL